MTAYVRPTTLDEAVAARGAHPDYLVLAGGTDAMVGAADPARPEPPGIIDVFACPPLCGVSRAGDGTIRIGAATTYAQILASADCRDHLPALVAAAREVGALQIQERGTLGGNVGTSSPVGDTLPVLLALDASVELASAKGKRSLPYEQFCTGYRTTALAPDELIVAIVFPPQPAGAIQYWRKVGTRRAQSISKVMIAARGRIDGGVARDIRIGLGAVRERPIRATTAEAAIEGAAAAAATADAARAAVATDISPIDDVRSTAAYRAAVTGNLVARFVLTLAESA